MAADASLRRTPSRPRRASCSGRPAPRWRSARSSAGSRRGGARAPRRRDRGHPALGRGRLPRLLARRDRERPIFETPRPMPGRLVPALAGSVVVVLALPVFVVAGWPLTGWLLAATLWLAGQAFAWLLTRLPLGTGNLAAAGMRGIGTSFRAFAIGHSARRRHGLGRARRHRRRARLRARLHRRARRLAPLVLRRRGARMKRLVTLATALFLALPSLALAQTTEGAEEEFDPAHEWELQTWVDLPLGLDINKAVAYVILGTVVTLRARHRADARQVRPRADQASGGRRDDLRGRPGAGRRAGAARRRRSAAGSRTSRR